MRVVVSFLLISGAAFAHAQTAPPLAPLLQVSPEVQAIMNRMASAEFESLRGQIRMEGQAPVPQGEDAAAQEPMITEISFVLAAPNRLRVQVNSPVARGDGFLISDGERIHCQSGIAGQSVSSEAPAAFSELSPEILALSGSGSMILPTLMGIRDPMREEFARSIPVVEEITGEMLASTECTVVATRTDRLGGGFTTRRYSVDAQGILRSFSVQVEDPEWAEPMRMTETLSSLEVNVPTIAADFDVGSITR